MLNWPGAKGRNLAPATGDRVRVKVSPVSRVTCLTTNGSGRMGSEAETVVAAASVVAIKIQELHAGRLEAGDHHLGEPLQELVAEGRVLLALRAQAGPVERQGPHRVEGARVEAGPVGRKEPRPAEHLAALDRLDGDRPLVGHEHLDRDPPLPDHVEPVGGRTLAEDELARLEDDVGDAPDHGVEVRAGQVLEEGVLAEDLLEAVDGHGRPPCASPWRSARASAVMSMPTGHHVMQLPQPTQPETPNWSCHVASL